MPEIKVTFDAAEDYERFMGRWSRAIGERFIDWLAPASSLRWLDVGCGTGAFTELILKRCAPKTVAGVDPAPAQAAHARKQSPQADIRVADATALPFDDSAFDIVASALVINFIPDRDKALREMSRVLRPGGTVSAYLWNRDATEDHSPHVPMEHGLRDIGAEVLRPPMAPESSVAGARAALERASFDDVAVTMIDVPQTYRDFDDYWQVQAMPFAPIGKSIAALSEAKRAELRALMHKKLPAANDGSITFSARAVAFKARKAG